MLGSVCNLRASLSLKFNIVYSMSLVHTPHNIFVVNVGSSSSLNDFLLMLMYRWLVESFSTHGLRTIVLLGALHFMTICLSQDQKMEASKFGI